MSQPRPTRSRPLARAARASVRSRGPAASAAARGSHGGSAAGRRRSRAGCGGRDARAVGLGDRHAGVRQAQGCRDAVADQLLVGQAGPTREDVAEQAAAEVGVAKARTRRAAQPYRLERRVQVVDREAGEGVVAVAHGLRPEALRRAPQPDRVGGQVGPRDLAPPVGGDGDGRRHPGADRLVERDEPLLGQHGPRQRGEHLGDRADLEARVLGRSGGMGARIADHGAGAADDGPRHQSGPPPRPRRRPDHRVQPVEQRRRQAPPGYAAAAAAAGSGSVAPDAPPSSANSGGAMRR